MSITLPRWFAHRGGGSLAPENTLAGIRLAASLGYQAVEFDVMLSGDGTPVLIHDETLERTTNGHGLVSETADSVLFALDAGGGEPVPRFADAAALCCELGLLANIEIKPAAGHEIETARRVAEMTGKLWHTARVQPLISSFSLEALEIARDLAPNIPRGILFETVPPHWLDDMRRLEAMTLHCQADSLSDAVLAEAAARYIPVLCFTVNAEKQAKNLLGRGVSAMFSDRLDLFASEAAL
jgi:glycerophosphoryl diester phosphodiesterase